MLSAQIPNTLPNPESGVHGMCRICLPCSPDPYREVYLCQVAHCASSSGFFLPLWKRFYRFSGSLTWCHNQGIKRPTSSNCWTYFQESTCKVMSDSLEISLHWLQRAEESWERKRGWFEALMALTQQAGSFIPLPDALWYSLGKGLVGSRSHVSLQAHWWCLTP